MTLQVDKTRKMLMSKLNILKNPFSPAKGKLQLYLHTDATKGVNGAEYFYEYEVMMKPHVYLVIKHIFTW